MNFLHFTTNLLPIVTMIVLEPIGFVHNTCTTSQAPEFIKKKFQNRDSSRIFGRFTGYRTS